MFPRLFEIGPLTVYTYGVLLAAAYLGALQYALVRAKHRGLDPARVMDLGIFIIVAALVGAKGLLVLVDFEHFRENPREIFSLMRAGGVFYGGLILATLVAIWYVLRHRLPVWQIGDIAAPAIALGHVVGRFGCLFAGCCYGRPTDVAWAVTFTHPEANAIVGTPLGEPVHPTQLYEAGAELLILVALVATERRGRVFAGRTFWLYMLLYGVSRFVIEFYRGDPRGTAFGVLSTSQAISVVLVPLAIVMLWTLSRRQQPAGPALAPATRGTPSRRRQA